MLLVNANQWHQPVNSQKTNLIIFSTAVKHPKLNVTYDNNRIAQVKSFKYLGYVMDYKMSFKHMIDEQLRKCKKACSILKHIHRYFPSCLKLKSLFYTTYIWPHISSLSTIYCLTSTYQQERLNGFYRRCLRITYCLFQCPTLSLHQSLRLATLKQKLQQAATKRLFKMQTLEPEIVACYIASKTTVNVIQCHFETKKCVEALPNGRAGNRLFHLFEDTTTFFEKLFQFADSLHVQ